jgi:rod shape-determining protein MreC
MQDIHFRLYTALVLACVFLMTWQVFSGPLKPFAFVGTGTAHLNNLVDSVSHGTGEFITNAFRAEAEIARLRRELEDVRLLEQRYRETTLENERLRELLNLGEPEYQRVTAARVIGRGGSRWQRAVRIDKGAADGIRTEMVVITPDGLAGKVVEVEDGYSVVLLVDDPRFGVAVRMQSTRAEAIVRGAGQGHGRLKYVPRDGDVAVGEALVTSGLDALFPRGLGVGNVTGVTEPEQGIFASVDVTPYVDTAKLEEVLVVTR